MEGGKKPLTVSGSAIVASKGSRATQDFQIFTTSPISDCDDGCDPFYPPGGLQPKLSDYLANPLPDRWQRVVIPLHAGSCGSTAIGRKPG